MTYKQKTRQRVQNKTRRNKISKKSLKINF